MDYTIQNVFWIFYYFSNLHYELYNSNLIYTLNYLSNLYYKLYNPKCKFDYLS